jgi:hypothetical protein
MLQGDREKKQEKEMKMKKRGKIKSQKRNNLSSKASS